jgi:hypothetical protein
VSSTVWPLASIAARAALSRSTASLSVKRGASRPPGEILDREAGDARADAEPHALVDAFGVAGEAGLEIRVEGKIDRVRKIRDVA